MHTNTSTGLTIQCLKCHWKEDLQASIWVFMVSLPISMAIAQASHFPITSGLITAGLGGLLVSVFSRSPFSIKAPSISLVVVVAIAVHNLSPYASTSIHYVLAMFVLAGSIQVLIGLLRLNKLLSIIPDSVVYGIISALSLQVLIHQFYYFVKMPLRAMPVWWMELELNIGLFYDGTNLSLLGILCVVLLFFPLILGQRFSKNLPAVFLALMLGWIWGAYYPLQGEINKDVVGIFILPNFTDIRSIESIEYAFLIALISTLESQLNTRSTEVLDKHRNKSKPYFETIILGFGNILCGLIGGIPMVTTVENSMVNINQRARSQWASIYQALFLIIFLFLIVPVLGNDIIPQAALAAILIYVIYKLNSPKLFQGIWEIGIDQFIMFTIALVLTMVFGIWMGLLGGILSTFAIYLFLGSPIKSLLYTPLDINKRNKRKGKVKISVKGAALCSNYLYIQRRLQKLLDNERLIIDLSQCKVVEYGFLDQIYQFAYWNNLNDGQMELQGLKYHRHLSKHPLCTLIRSNTKKKQQFYLPSTSLSERQIDIQAVASVNNARLETNLTYDGVVFQGFSFALGYEIRYRENKFMIFHDGNTIEFSDVFLSKGLRMSEQNHKMSVLLVTVMNARIPNFTLGQEAIVDKVWQTVGYEDIDFDGHPKFSENYLLNGENQDEIRHLFTPELIYLLEDYTSLEVHMEANNNRLLIYCDRDLSPRIVIEDLIEFTEKFLDIVYQGEKVEDLVE